MLYGRDRETDFLNQKFKDDSSQMIVVYGKRRIGKTELLKDFCQDKNSLFYVCRETTDQEQIRLFSKKILEGSPLQSYLRSFEDWEDAFRFLLESAKNEKKIIVIDEFPYMVQNNPSLPSILQGVWDEHQKDSKLMLILTGSSVNFIERELLNSDKPLFARTSGVYEVDELSFMDSLLLLEGEIKDKIFSWAVVGGVPRYLNQFVPEKDFRENLISNILSKGSALFNEVEFLMKQDLREPSTYFTILEALAEGKQKINEISKETGLDRTKVNVYLKNLINLKIVERITPMVFSEKTETNTGHNSIYRITNNYFRFYFRFIYPNFSELEENETEAVFQHKVAPYLNDFIELSLYEGAKDYLRKLNRNRELSFYFDRIGKSWNKETFLELVAADDKKNLLTAKVFIKERPINIDDLELFKEETVLLKKTSYKKYYYLFSTSGFEQKLLNLAELDESIRLINLLEI